ncbi:T9SS type A sorting domain-containing protein [Microvirga sp. STR05]|uniref:T9SS type A sorting domain-containing protein n=1 Tax=Hymenobacter duratus TaxID=2771356 RepID=A0ABR8JH35_9BACT|nr:T9SS type A sorting domain-containing protein [Hymenobacter duratus]MBD2714916.1 T9SS type A sorting domain-containing protein [Hymenobacter duratus]MBR7949822.1 T9SS type A sorting domain-containing protein [Microvirga sp. STR05]
MKTSLRNLAAALSLLTATTVSAQTTTVPNGTLDTWITRSTLEVPQSWSTIDEAIKTVPVFGGLYTSVTTAKDAGSRTGAFAARMETKLDPFLGSLIGPVPGGIVLGSVDATAIDIAGSRDVSAVGGLPFTTRAASMQFYYKLTGANALADSAYALVSLTRTVGGNVQTIASGSLRLLPEASYSLGTIPLQYASSLAPDSIHIAFASGFSVAPTVGTVLVVDDVVMSGTVAATRNTQLTASLQAYPNPSASGLFTLAAVGHDNVLATASLTVLDALGRVVLQQPAARTSGPRTLDLQAQPAGLYTLRLDTPDGFAVQKLMTQ